MTYGFVERRWRKGFTSLGPAIIDRSVRGYIVKTEVLPPVNAENGSRLRAKPTYFAFSDLATKDHDSLERDERTY
jgi:hypothetical protein